MIETAKNLERRKLPTVHALRASAALLVMLVHIRAWDYATGTPLTQDFSELSRLGTDLFFVVSGAVVALSTTQVSWSRRSVFSFLYDRLSRIMPLYWFLTAVVLAIWSLSGQKLLSQFVHTPEFWSTAFLLPTGHLSAIPVAWSLTNIILCYLVFAATSLLAEKKRTTVLCAWVALILLGRAIGLDKVGSPLLDLLVHPSSIEFVAGILLMQAALKGRKANPTTCLLSAIGIMVVIAAFFNLSPTLDVFADKDLRLFTLGAAAVLLTAWAVFRDFSGDQEQNKIMRFLGDTSFGLYLGHSLCIALIGRLWMGVAEYGQWTQFVALMLMAPASIAFGWVLHRFVELPLKTMTIRWKPHALRNETSAPRPQEIPKPTQDNEHDDGSKKTAA